MAGQGKKRNAVRLLLPLSFLSRQIQRLTDRRRNRDRDSKTGRDRQIHRHRERGGGGGVDRAVLYQARLIKQFQPYEDSR